jgi:hypothetical protein
MNNQDRLDRIMQLKVKLISTMEILTTAPDILRADYCMTDLFVLLGKVNKEETRLRNLLYEQKKNMCEGCYREKPCGYLKDARVVERLNKITLNCWRLMSHEEEL